MVRRPNYRIHREGPIEDEWEVFINRIDWAFIVGLLAICLFHLLPAMLRS